MIPVSSSYLIDTDRMLFRVVNILCFACDLKSGMITLIATWLLGRVFLESLWKLEDENIGTIVIFLILCLVSFFCMFAVLTYIVEIQKKLRI